MVIHVLNTMILFYFEGMYCVSLHNILYFRGLNQYHAKAYKESDYFYFRIIIRHRTVLHRHVPAWLSFHSGKPAYQY